MGHKSKEFWGLIAEAAKVCRTERNGVTVKLYPLDKTKKIFTAHEGEPGVHPLRRYLKNTLGIN